MTKALTCRTHGGKFVVEARRGRPPVRCTPDNPCSELSAIPREKPTPKSGSLGLRHPADAKTARNKRLTPEASMSRAQRDSAAIRNTPTPHSAMQEVFEDEKAAAREAAVKLQERIATAQAKVKGGSESVLLAQAAKNRLEPLGWLCKGRAWVVGVDKRAEVIATRGEETIYLGWLNGEMVEQTYQVWDMDAPKNNGKPASTLGFDPDEMTDRELVKRLSGMPVVWWNALGAKEEKSTIPSNMQIEHAYNGIGDETPADRIVKFIEVGGSYRAFRVGALMKVGK